MIRIAFWQDAGGNYRGYEVRGHAGYAGHGRDIVCAAVSALAQTGVLAMENQLSVKPEVSVREGFLSCHLPAETTAADKDRGEVILAAMYVGLKEICASYAEHASLEIRRCP